MRSAMRRMIDPIEMLSADHESVKALFERCQQTEPGLKRKLLVNEIFKDLYIHATLEEEIFYPAVRQHLGQEGLEFIREAYREHGNITGLIRELERLDPNKSAFMERM